MKILAGAAAVLVMATAVPGATMAAKLTPERVFADPDLSGPRARTVKIAPDGSAVAFLRAKPDDQRTTDLWIAPIDGSPPRMLIDGRALTPKGAALSADEKSRRERQGIQSHGASSTIPGTRSAAASWPPSRATSGSTTGRPTS